MEVDYDEIHILSIMASLMTHMTKLPLHESYQYYFPKIIIFHQSCQLQYTLSDMLLCSYTFVSSHLPLIQFSVAANIYSIYRYFIDNNHINRSRDHTEIPEDEESISVIHWQDNSQVYFVMRGNQVMLYWPFRHHVVCMWKLSYMWKLITGFRFQRRERCWLIKRDHPSRERILGKSKINKESCCSHIFLNILGEPVEPTRVTDVTMLFSDIVGFTAICSNCTPLTVVNMLNSVYTNFDNICGTVDVYKVIKFFRS